MMKKQKKKGLNVRFKSQLKIRKKMTKTVMDNLYMRNGKRVIGNEVSMTQAMLDFLRKEFGVDGLEKVTDEELGKIYDICCEWECDYDDNNLDPLQRGLVAGDIVSYIYQHYMM